MTFLAPFAFALGLAAAGVIVALHLLTTKRPPSQPLPTARFVPMAEARAVARTRRPTDLMLLALRALVLLLIGGAFARPVLDAPGPEVRTVVLLDVSASVAAPADAAARAREALGEGSALVVFDTAARVVAADLLDSMVAAGAGDAADEDDSADALASSGAVAARPAYGSLSPALAAARRVAGDVARGADSLRLVIISPVTDAGLDAATPAWRAAWPGRIEFVRIAARAADSARSRAPELVGAAADDPIAPALAREAATMSRSHAVRIVRRDPTAADSAWARGSGRVLVAWSRTIAPSADAPSSGAPTVIAPNPDASLLADAVHVSGPGGVALVAPLARRGVPPGHTLARWRDGAAAVTEIRIGGGCIRSVGVLIPSSGDLTLRPPFARFLGAMLSPCGGEAGTPVADSVLTALAGTGPLAPARLLAVEGSGGSRLPALLLALALLGLGAEWWLRRRKVA